MTMIRASEMPSTTPERSARWPGMDSEAIDFLQGEGYKLNRDYTWTKPTPDHIPTEREKDAVIYLFEEWDFDVIRRDEI